MPQERHACGRAAWAGIPHNAYEARQRLGNATHFAGEFRAACSARETRTGGPLTSVVTGTRKTSPIRLAAVRLAGRRSFSKRQTDSGESCARRATSILVRRRFLRAWRNPVNSTITTATAAMLYGSEIHTDFSGNSHSSCSGERGATPRSAVRHPDPGDAVQLERRRLLWRREQCSEPLQQVSRALE